MPSHTTVPQDTGFLELSLDGHWIFDKEFNLWYANRLGREIASFKPERDHTLKPQALFVKGGEDLRQHLGAALESGSITDDVIQLNTTAESWILRIRTRRKNDPATGDTHLYSTLRDLSGDRIDRLIREVSNRIPTAMVLTNSCGRMFYKNDAFTRMFRYSTFDSYDDRLFSEQIFKNSDEGKKVQKTLLQTGRYEGVHEMLRKSGEIIIVRHRAYILYKAHKEIAAYCGIYEDITNERAAQKVLKSAKLRAEEGNRAKLDFLAMISHELRTPLNPVLAGSELLAITTDAQERNELCEMIHQGGQGLLTVINEIIDYVSRTGQANEQSVEEVNLHSEMDRYYKKALYYADKKGVNVELKCDASLIIKVRSNANDLWQVMKQLITNAVKFTPTGGTITIHAKCENNVEHESQSVIIEVEDNGVGIPADMQNVIFDPFRQADMSATRTHGGIGLGLALARDIAHHLSGELTCTSKLNEGSTFRFVFPCNWNIEVPVVTPPVLDISAEQSQILIIEDNHISANTLSRLLKEIGYHSEHFASAKEGIEALSRDTYHLVLMDIQMPKMNGYQASRMIRKGAAGEHNKDIPIIAVTAHALPEDIQRSLESGMNAHLSKPITIKALKEKIEVYLPLTQ